MYAHLSCVRKKRSYLSEQRYIEILCCCFFYYQMTLFSQDDKLLGMEHLKIQIYNYYNVSTYGYRY